MKIAFFAGLFPELSDTFILSQITGLIDRGHDVHIFADRPGASEKLHPDYVKYGIADRLTYWPSGPAGIVGRAATLARFALTRPTALSRAKCGFLAGTRRLLANVDALRPLREFDIIHCHYGPNGMLATALRACGVLRGRVSVVFHAYDVTRTPARFGERCYTPLFESAEWLAPISEFWRERLIRMGAGPRRVSVHHMGIDCGSFAFQPTRSLSGRPARLLMIARLVEKKGVRYAIEAVAKLRAFRERVHLRILGDGPLRSQIESQVKVLKAEGAVELAGWADADEVRAALRDSDALLAPSVTAADGDMEGIPMVLMEAMAMGVPVISTRHSGIPELIENGVSGLLAPERDVDALADHIERLLRDTALREHIRHAGRRRVEDAFNIDRLNDELVRRFEEMA
ncbi:MAG: glycosyltransferase [Phycisphaerales bacterium]|nr:glycosyltransferase [Phycisphaerales bacterium]